MKNNNTMEEETQKNNNGTELCLNGIYVAILACSYYFVIKMFNESNGDYRSSYVNCFILVVPCVIDGTRELLNYTKKQKFVINVVDLAFGILCFIIAVCLFFAIITNIECKTFASIIIYSSIVCICSNAAHLASELVDACKLKFSGVKEE